ncbi:hypothetical protein AgCh_008966 [Apium graveolens]
MGHVFFNKFKEKVKNQKRILDSLRDKYDDGSVKQFLIEKERLNEILMHEEIYWKHRAKLFWLKEGDANTRFFHACASVRRKTTHLKFLETKVGHRVETLEEMGEVVKGYFEGVFKEPETQIVNTPMEVPRMVTQEQNRMLTKDVTFEEFTIECCREWLKDCRSTTDNVVVAFELIYHMKRKGRSQEGEVALKLDISKAYDRVNWQYLKQRMIDRAQANGMIHGSRVSPTAPEITHLLFADDSFLFFRASREEAIRVRDILKGYENFSAQGRGIKWHSWDNMSMSKDRGGMGFRILQGLLRVKGLVIFGRGFRLQKNLSSLGLDGSLETEEMNLSRLCTKLWNESKIIDMFSATYAIAILAISVPQRDVGDRVAWSRSKNGLYDVKTGYQLWHDQHIGDNLVPRSSGWSRLWKLHVPHKIKILMWRLCRNNLPVRDRLKAKGVSILVSCPMCNADLEHIMHLFFECQFVESCWRSVDLSFDMRNVTSAQEWLLKKFSEASHEELGKIYVVLWGVWYWRNKRVWEGKMINPKLAIEGSFRTVEDWRKVRGGEKETTDADTFTIGMLIRDHRGHFLEGRSLTLVSPGNVMEAESMGIKR